MALQNQCAWCENPFTPAHKHPHQQHCTQQCRRLARGWTPCNCGTLKAPGSNQCAACAQPREHPALTAYTQALNIALERNTPPAQRAAARTVMRHASSTFPEHGRPYHTGFGALIAAALTHRINM